MRRIALACLIFLFAAPLLTPSLLSQTAPAPVWFMVSAESATVSVTIPAGATYRFGSPTAACWSASTTVAQATTFSPVSMSGGSVFPFADPCRDIVKELDVLEIAAAQTLSISDLAVTPNTTMALAVPSIAPPTTIPVPAGQVYTVTMSISTTATNYLDVDLYGVGIGIFDLPVTGPSMGYIGSVVNLTIDGVTMACTYGSAVNGIFSLSCAVPAN